MPIPLQRRTTPGPAQEREQQQEPKRAPARPAASSSWFSDCRSDGPPTLGDILEQMRTDVARKQEVLNGGELELEEATRQLQENEQSIAQLESESARLQVEYQRMDAEQQRAQPYKRWDEWDGNAGAGNGEGGEQQDGDGGDTGLDSFIPLIYLD